MCSCNGTGETEKHDNKSLHFSNFFYSPSYSRCHFETIFICFSQFNCFSMLETMSPEPELTFRCSTKVHTKQHSDDDNKRGRRLAPARCTKCTTQSEFEWLFKSHWRAMTSLWLFTCDFEAFPPFREKETRVWDFWFPLVFCIIISECFLREEIVWSTSVLWPRENLKTCRARPSSSSSSSSGSSLCNFCRAEQQISWEKSSAHRKFNNILSPFSTQIDELTNEIYIIDQRKVYPTMKTQSLEFTIIRI